MKYKKTLIFVAIILVLVVLLASKVYAQLQLPRISTACESKDGYFRSFNDGFSFLKSCPKSSRLVVVGERPQAKEISVFAPQKLTEGQESGIIDTGEHRVITFNFGGGGEIGGGFEVYNSDSPTVWPPDPVYSERGDSKQWVQFVKGKYYKVRARYFTGVDESFVSAILD